MTFDQLLAEIQSACLTLKPGQPDTRAVNQIFQALEAIQNLASMSGLEEISSFTSHIQDLLLQVRSGAVPLTDHFPGVILAAAAQIKLLLSSGQGGAPVDLNLQAALLETVFQMTEPTVQAWKSRPPEQEASCQDAIVLPVAENIPAC